MKKQKPIIMDLDDALKADQFKQRSFNLRNSQYKALKKIAKDLGLNWGNQPSIGRMLKAICDGKLLVVKKG